MTRSSPKRSALLPLIALMLLLSPCVMYSGVYIWARATHKLVRYSGNFIARPNTMPGGGVTTWEFVFAPLTWTEEHVREPFTRW